MKYLAVTSAALACLIAFLPANSVQASTSSKKQQCENYARNATRNTGTSTGVVRGAFRGGLLGEMFGDSASKGARAGAVVGGTRHVAQKARSYNYYYNKCMNK